MDVCGRHFKGRSRKTGNRLDAVVASFAFERLSLLAWLLGLDADQPHRSSTARAGRMDNVVGFGKWEHLPHDELHCQ